VTRIVAMRIAKILLFSALMSAAPGLALGELASRFRLGEAENRVRQAQADVSSAQGFSDDVHWRIRKLPAEIRSQEQALVQYSDQIAKMNASAAALAKQFDDAQRDWQHRQAQISDVAVQLGAAQLQLDRTRSGLIAGFETSRQAIEARAAIDVADAMLSNASALVLRELATTMGYQQATAQSAEAKARWMGLRYLAGADATSIAEAARASSQAVARLQQLEREALDADIVVREARADLTAATGAARKLRADFEVQLVTRPQVAPLVAAVNLMDQTRGRLTRELAAVDASVVRTADEHRRQTQWLKDAGAALVGEQAKLDSLKADYQAAVAAVHDVDWSLADASNQLAEAVRYRDEVLVACGRDGSLGGAHRPPDSSPPPVAGGGEPTPTPAPTPTPSPTPQALRTVALDSGKVQVAMPDRPPAYDPYTPREQSGPVAAADSAPRASEVAPPQGVELRQARQQEREFETSTRMTTQSRR
jgi:hypothetical protein